ncbi:MAG: hypothetical protein QM673_14225 [Gordonia sp. (in: high G+C Gram-positive bacteria)]
MAHHRAAGGGRGIRRNAIAYRGVSRGLVFVLLSIVLVAGIVVAWLQLGDHLDRQADQAAATCVEGHATVAVIADPDLVDGLTAIAREFADSKPVVRDHCISIAVRAGDAKVTLDGLTGTWDTASLGQFPAAWVPQSSVWSAQLATTAPTAIEGSPQSLVISPVVLATSPALASKFNARLDWAALPMLQWRDASLREFGLTGWGSIRMALPIGGQSDASALAAQAVAMRVTHTTGTLTAADARSPRVASSIRAMLTGPASPDGTPTGAATTIRDAADPATASIHAVPITEQRLYQLTRTDSIARLSEVIPSGPTPVADYPVIRLAGDRVPDFASDAVAQFFTFAAAPDHLRLLTGFGFRGDAPLPKATPTVSFPITNDPMASPENAAIVTINKLVFGAGIGPSA